MFVIAHGSPFDGLGLVGPFSSMEAAAFYADEVLFAMDWHVVKVEAPISKEHRK